MRGKDGFSPYSEFVRIYPLPNTGNAAPLTAREASEAKNRITSAMAAGSTHLLKSPLGTAARFCGVSIVPGMMQFTLMFDTFSSAASDSVNRSTALFDALYAAYPALPDKPSRLA